MYSRSTPQLFENRKLTPDVHIQAICGLTHTQNTKVGNDFVRGVSGGERKVKRHSHSFNIGIF